MSVIFSYGEWVDICNRGTSGDQVMDILASWKVSAYNHLENIHKLQAEIDCLKLVADKFYLLLVDNPDTKLLADAILCEVYGIETLEEK